MVNNDRYFYLSGFISISLFVLFLLLFISMMLQQEKLKQFALKKDNYISISIDTPLINKKTFKKNIKKEPPSPKKEIKKEEPKPIEKPVVQKKTEDMKKNISDLFSSVTTQKIEEKKEKKPVVDKKLLSKLSRQTAKKTVSESAMASSMIKKIEISSQSTSTSPDVNEYLARIQAIIYEHFYPPMNSEGHSAVISIRFDSFGKMLSYKVLTYSGNDMFNSEVDSLKARLQVLTFAKHPQGKSENLKIILTSQE